MLRTLVHFIATRSLLTKLIILSTIFVIVLPFLVVLGSINGSWLSSLFNANNLGTVLGTVFTIWSIFLFILGAIYFLTGIVRFMYEKIKKIQKPKRWHTKSMIIKGLGTVFLSLLVFYLLTLAAGFFGLSLGNCMCLPKLLPPDSQNSDTGFPVGDIKVLGVTQGMLSPVPSISNNPILSPNPSGVNNGVNCIITLKNSSNTLTATNASLEYYDTGQQAGEQVVEDDYFTNTDHILPGQTYQVQVNVLQNDCNIIKSVKILSAGIAKNP